MTAALLVRDALEPVIHHVRPEATLSEVIDLMVRHRVGAVPVVGEDSEVLGIITSGDALQQVLMDSPGEDGVASDDRLTARDVMTRTVLCVSEGQALMDAAHMMVNKRVEQIPVVREGALIGIVTRSRVLRELHLAGRGETETKPGDGS